MGGSNRRGADKAKTIAAANNALSKAINSVVSKGKNITGALKDMAYVAAPTQNANKSGSRVPVSDKWYGTQDATEIIKDKYKGLAEKLQSGVECAPKAIETLEFNVISVATKGKFAFIYDWENDTYYTSEVDGFQRLGGFMDLYDDMAPLLGMDLDTETVYYTYEGKEYRLQFWKGSYGYGAGYGGEIGIYYNNGNGNWYKTVSGEYEKQIKQVLIDKSTGDFLIQNDLSYAMNQDHYWNLAIRTDRGYTKNDLTQISYLSVKDEKEMGKIKDALRGNSKLRIEEISTTKIKIFY